MLHLLSTLALAQDSWLNRPEAPVQVALHGELGTLAVVSHRIQFSQDGSTIDYVDDGAQDTLFPFARLSADIHRGRNTFVLLYQPLSLQTSGVAGRDLVVDGETFPEGTPMEFRYDFPFYRGSYMRQLGEGPGELALGASLQIRNANIQFTSTDGTLRRANRNIGPVPALKFRAHKPLESGWFLGAEVDGMYAPIKYLNGDAEADVVGAIVDANLRAGVELDRGTELFLNLRYLAGGASGTDPNTRGLGDGYTENWLQFATLSLGASLK